MENLRTPERIEALIRILKEYNAITDELAVHMADATLDSIQNVCNDFMNRTRINSEAMIPLFEIYKQEPSLLLPIGLILRSVLSDFLTSSYLLTFYDPEKNDFESLNNELQVFDRDFLRSLEKGIALEKEIHELNPAFEAQFADEEAYQAKLLDIKKKFSVLFEDNDPSKNYKKIDELRASSDREKYFESDEEFNGSGRQFMSEEYKFERIKKRGFGLYASAFIPFKYFSQFQHYSKRGFAMMDEQFEGFGYFHIVHSINVLLISTQFQIRIVEGKEGNFTKRIAELIPKLNEALS